MSEFWIGLIAALIYIPLLLIWTFSFVDVFTRRDLSGRGKAGWILAIIFLPLLGTLIYLTARPSKESELARAAAALERSRAQELEVLVRLQDEGKITPDEYTRLKLNVVGS